MRSNLIQQFNDLRTQIDELAKDSGYNGVNLLQGDKVSIQFNEKTGKNQSKLDIQGSTLSSDNLGISQATNTTLTGFSQLPERHRSGERHEVADRRADLAEVDLLLARRQPLGRPDPPGLHQGSRQRPDPGR